MVSGTLCKFLFYEKSERDTKHPFTRTEKKIQNKLLENVGVNSFIQPNEDTLIAGLTNGNLMVVQISMDKAGAEDNYGFEPLVFDFHTD
mgnify:CR=1 FL=1